MSESLATWGMVVAAVLVGVVEAFKRAGVPARVLPLVALALGIVVGVAWAVTRPVVTADSVLTGVLVGAMLGLSAVGLYSGTTNVLERRP